MINYRIAQLAAVDFHNTTATTLGSRERIAHLHRRPIVMVPLRAKTGMTEGHIFSTHESLNITDEYTDTKTTTNT